MQKSNHLNPAQSDRLIHHHQRLTCQTWTASFIQMIFQQLILNVQHPYCQEINQHLTVHPSHHFRLWKGN